MQRRVCSVCGRLFRSCVICGRYLTNFSESKDLPNVCRGCREGLKTKVYSSLRVEEAVKLAKTHAGKLAGLRALNFQLEIQNKRLRVENRKLKKKLKWKS